MVKQMRREAKLDGGETESSAQPEGRFESASQAASAVKSDTLFQVQLFGWLVGFLTSSSANRLYRGRVPRLTFDNFTRCYTRDRTGRP